MEDEQDKEKDWTCFLDYVDVDKYIDGLPEREKEGLLKVEMKLKIMIDDVFRDHDIKKWLRQKQIYFGWNHNYNIKDQKFQWFYGRERYERIINHVKKLPFGMQLYEIERNYFMIEESIEVLSLLKEYHRELKNRMGLKS